MPSGVTVTYGTNPVAQTGGTSVITFIAAAGATIGGPTTISCIGTSGATVSTAATFALTVTAPAAGAGTLSLGTISTYAAQSLTGSADWVVQQTATFATGPQNWQDRKSGGTIFTAGASDTTIGAGGGGNAVSALNWTDGTVSASGSANVALEMALGSANGLSFTLASDTTARTLTVFAGLGSGGAGSMTVTATSSVAGVNSVQHTLTSGTINAARAFTFTFQNAGTVTITVAVVGSTANVILSAAKVI